MEQQVTVIAVEGHEAVVSGRRASACGDCAGKTSCATLGSWVERVIELRVHNKIGAKTGDRVVLEVPDSVVLRIAFRLYAIPMLAFVVAGLVTRSMALHLGWPAVEAVAALGGLLAVLVYYLWYKSHLAGLASDSTSGLDVRMVRVIRTSSGHPGDSLPVSSH
ncbi:MAG: SoxR reducing system RseC family protein [Mariprofundus sp.]|nr:SoxR reducing system RseC family protein [Mariprofundus sp.]